MKNISILILLVAICFISCQKDNASPDNTLNYDGDNFTAPSLPFGEHFFAARFTNNELEDYIGKSLKEVTFFVGQLPENCFLEIYEGGTDSEPGERIYNADLSNGLVAPEWNTHSLATPIEITGKDLWLAVKVFHLQNQQSIGCDTGPRNPNGDWMNRQDNPGWKTFAEIVPGESVNWNIRGIVE